MSQQSETPKHSFALGHDGSVFEYDGNLGETEFDDLLIWSADRKASDVTIQSGEVVKADIGGRLVGITERPTSYPEVERMVSYIYGQNGPAEIMSGHDLDPSHEITVEGRGRMRFRVNVTGGRGIQITIRTLPQMPPKISALGIEQEILDNVRPPNGMILVTGPTGSGKSTLLSSIIRMLVENPDANEKVLEYSKPVEYVYDRVDKHSSSVHQTEVGRHLRPKHDLSGDEESEFAYCVRNALRRKPTIILIGEARDKATISASVEAALTGHLLFTTMHTIGVPETLRRAVTKYPGDERRSVAVDIMESLRMVVTQILIPRRGGGNVGCREYMIFDEAVREQLLNVDVDEWPRLVREILASGKCRGRSMAQSARALFEAGEIEEATYRYFAQRQAQN